MTEVHGLKFGDNITKENLSAAGLSYPEDANNECYYVSLNPPETLPRPNFLVVVDNQLGMVSINSAGVNAFSGVALTDDVANILAAHPDAKPHYYVDKYDDGDSSRYHLVYDLAGGTQIDYFIEGGVKMASDDIRSSAWTDADAKGLKGKVKTIAIGQPETIALVEGCS